VIAPTSRGPELEAYDRAAASLLSLIRGKTGEARSALDRRSRAEARLARARALLSALGDPHLRYPVVHVTGTSGKGSTSAAIASVLTEAGFRVGLRTSPYLQVPTEKLHIGASLIDATAFDELARRVLAAGSCLFPSNLGYAEVWVALACSWFAEQQVDLAVVEVGAGGRFDTTNVFQPLVSVITSVGLDHVVSLGPSLADIAWHKAGIIKRGGIAVVGDMPDDAWSVIAQQARDEAVSVIRPAAIGEAPESIASLPDGFRRANAQMALGVLEALRTRGYAIPDAAIAAAVSGAGLPGRFERMPTASGADIWLDGAHNPDKAAALAREISRLIECGGKLPVVVLGVLAAKDAAAIVARLSPLAAAVVATQPTVLGKRALPAAALGEIVRATGFAGPLLVEVNPGVALHYAREVAHATGSAVVVAGSLYLAGDVRRAWYADDDIVLQRTPWPTPRNLMRS
jgi:dihydrofolate synthase/folylpolyglutamate synthase